MECTTCSCPHPQCTHDGKPNAASTHLWSGVEPIAAFLNGCVPCGKARLRFDMEGHRSTYAQRSRITLS